MVWCVRGSEWVICDWCVVYNMCNRVDKDPLSLRQAEDDGVVLSRDDGRFLAIDDQGGLFSKQDLHVFQRVDWGALGHGCTWNSSERTLILEEMRHDDVIDTLRTSSGHGHDSGCIFRLKACQMSLSDRSPLGHRIMLCWTLSNCC